MIRQFASLPVVNQVLGGPITKAHYKGALYLPQIQLRVHTSANVLHYIHPVHNVLSSQ